MRYREVLRIHRVREHDRDVFLDRLGGAVAQIRYQFVELLVIFCHLGFASCTFLGVSGPRSPQRSNTLRFGASVRLGGLPGGESVFVRVSPAIVRGLARGSLAPSRRSPRAYSCRIAKQDLWADQASLTSAAVEAGSGLALAWALRDLTGRTAGASRRREISPVDIVIHRKSGGQERANLGVIDCEFEVSLLSVRLHSGGMRLSRLLFQPLAFRRRRAVKLHPQTFGCSFCILGPPNRCVVLSNSDFLSTLLFPSSYSRLVQ